MVSSRLLLTEVPRALRRYLGRSTPKADLAVQLRNAERLLRTTVLRPIDPNILREAAELTDPFLRSLDAIHVVTAVLLRSSIDCFVSYDKRQAAVARDEGLRVVSPGAPDS
jgi:predicted nucleic acid-binding protein